jgi:hypothetical protein
MLTEAELERNLQAIINKRDRVRKMRNGNGFSEPTKAAVAVIQRMGKIILNGEMCPWCLFLTGVVVDHIEPKARGGNNSAFNGMWICSVCNRKKSAQPLERWLDQVREEQGVSDIEVWLRCKDKKEYVVEIGRKLRKAIGWRESEHSPEEEKPTITPRPNPFNAVNAPMMLYDIFSNDRIIQHLIFGCGRRMG